MTEWGDDVRPLSEDEAMVIVNHQATGDVCTLMMCLQDKGTVRRGRTLTPSPHHFPNADMNTGAPVFPSDASPRLLVKADPAATTSHWGFQSC